MWSEGNPISAFDVAYLLLFIIARLCDFALVAAALKQKSNWDKTPLLVLPWLIINALELCLKVVFIMMLLFYGSQHVKMSTTDYTSTLAFIGVLTGAHIFCFLIIYQFRKNLVEERNIRRNTPGNTITQPLASNGTAGFEPSAPYGTGYGNSHRMDAQSTDKVDSNIPHGRMSPPPSYDEVVFNSNHVKETKKGSNDDALSASVRSTGASIAKRNNDQSNSKQCSKNLPAVSREQRRSTSRERNPTSYQDYDRGSRPQNTQNHKDLDERDRNHAPPQYSDAVRLPNINPSSHVSSTPTVSGSSTEQSGIL